MGRVEQQGERHAKGRLRLCPGDLGEGKDVSAHLQLTFLIYLIVRRQGKDIRVLELERGLLGLVLNSNILQLLSLRDTEQTQTSGGCLFLQVLAQALSLYSLYHIEV